MYYFKGPCHEIFDSFYKVKKNLHWPHLSRLKQTLSRRYSWKTCDGIVVDYADSVSLTTMTPYPRSRCYANTWILNIFAKTKKFAKAFKPVHVGPTNSLLSKKIEVESSVSKISTVRYRIPVMKQKYAYLKANFLKSIKGYFFYIQVILSPI